MKNRDLKIKDLGLSTRAMNVLNRAGVADLGALLEWNGERLRTLRNLGEKTLNEILETIDMYKDRADEETSSSEEDGDCQVQLIGNDGKEKTIADVDTLSARAYNILSMNGYLDLAAVNAMSRDQLLAIPHIDEATADEIKRHVSQYVTENCRTVKTGCTDSREHLMEAALKVAMAADSPIDDLGFSKRSSNCLRRKGYLKLSDILPLTEKQLYEMKNLGFLSVKEITAFIDRFFESNRARIKAVANGDDNLLYSDDEIKRRILALYEGNEQAGYAFEDFKEKLALPDAIKDERLKKIIGSMLEETTIEYVDFRCYRIYWTLAEALEKCPKIDGRNKEIFTRRLSGETLESVAADYGLTRERIRQLVKKELDILRAWYVSETGMKTFSEDYYRYLFENYSFEKNDGGKWIGVPKQAMAYFDLIGLKPGKKELEAALDDTDGLDPGLRLKIKNYLNRNKIFVDGIWIEKKRSSVEKYVIKKYCREEVNFTEFTEIYNSFLQEQEVPYDESLYYTEDTLRSRKNRISDYRTLLWKQNERLRYYDIDARDYTELIEQTGIALLENIEISTQKLLNEHPEVMRRYDIRDRYELHNLLKKAMPEGEFHDMKFNKMPDILFGEFDRTEAIADLLKANSPITAREFADIVYREYGYDQNVTLANYMKPFQSYYLNGTYSMDYQVMSEENAKCLKNVLTEDFYFIDEIRSIYKYLLPDADVEDINGYNLKEMGFQVYSKYVLQNHPSAEEYFTYALTKDDISDLSAFRKKYTGIVMANQVLQNCLRRLDILEFEHNKTMNIRRLEGAGITKNDLIRFRDEVYDYVEDGTYFTAKSLIGSGFKSELLDLGFSDWFYAGILAGDERFSNGRGFNAIVLYKGVTEVTRKSFETWIINQHVSIDVYDLMNEMTDKYGCDISARDDVMYLTEDEVFYDRYLDRFYGSEEDYYRELEYSEVI